MGVERARSPAQQPAGVVVVARDLQTLWLIVLLECARESKPAPEKGGVRKRPPAALTTPLGLVGARRPLTDATSTGACALAAGTAATAGLKRLYAVLG